MYDPYLAITAHYIEAPTDQPTDWSLKSKLIDFKGLKGSHSGANIAAKIVEVLDQYEIQDKVCKFEVFTLPGLFRMESMWNPWNPSGIPYGIHGMNVG